MAESEHKEFFEMMNWFLVALAMAGVATIGLIDNIRGPVFPDIIQDFGLSDSLASWFFASTSASCLVSTLVLYRFTERFGPIGNLRIFVSIQMIGLLAMAAANDYTMTIVGCVLLGLGAGSMGIVVNLLVSLGSPPEVRRRAFAGLHSAYGAASLLGPLLVTGLYAAGFSWHGVFLGMSAVSSLVLVFSFFGQAPERISHREADGVSGPRPWRMAVFYSGLLAAYVVAELSIGTRLSLYARREWGYSVSQANVLLSLFYVGLFAGRIAFALRRVSIGSTWILIVSAAVSLVSYALGLVVSPIWLAVTGIAMSVFYPVALARLDDEAQGRASFVLTWALTAQSVGLASMHALLGKLSDAFGLGKALWIGPICLVFVLALLVKPRFSRA